MDAISTKLLENGILGVIVVALLLALRYVFKLFVDSQEKRITRTEAIAEAATDATKSVNTTLSGLVEVLKDRERK